jgi:hypothetical protein
VVFGELKDGKSIIRKIENMPTQSDKPNQDVTIVGMLDTFLCIDLNLLTMSARLRPAVK